MFISRVIFISLLFVSCNTDSTLYDANDSEKEMIKDRIAKLCFSEDNTKSEIGDIIKSTEASFKELEKGDRFEVQFFRTDPNKNDGNEEETMTLNLTILNANENVVYIHIKRFDLSDEIDTQIPIYVGNLASKDQLIIKFTKEQNIQYSNIFKAILCDSKTNPNLSSDIKTFTQEDIGSTSTSKSIKFEMDTDYPAIFELIRRSFTKIITEGSDSNKTTVAYKSTFKGLSNNSPSNSDITDFVAESSELTMSSLKEGCCSVIGYFENSSDKWLEAVEIKAENIISGTP